MIGGPGAYWVGEEEKKELLEVIESGYLFRYGAEDNPRFKRKVYEFEQLMAGHTGVRHCVAVSSGTASLLCALAALDIGPGDEVIVPGYTFIASISTILLSRAIPVLAEINESLTVDPADIERKITKRTKAILPVHMLGNPCDMDRIMAIAKAHNLHVLEDVCQAAGASYHGLMLGSIGNIAGTSLNYFKTITSGDGGAVLTDDDNLYERAFGFHDHGHKPMRVGIEVGKRSIIGMNFRMNELTGAVALAQARKLGLLVETLRRKKHRYKQGLQGLPGVGFRTINDEAGECGTLLTLLFETKSMADAFAAQARTTTVASSGWHVYNNMEQILDKKTVTSFHCPYNCPANGGEPAYYAHMLPATDAILERAVNLSVGVVDRGLGAAFGININSTDDEIDATIEKTRQIILSL